MTEPQYENSVESSPSHTPKILLAFGIIVILFAACLTVRIIWEETFLTWRQGPQMIGFSLAHGSSAFLLFAPLPLCVWLIVAMIYLPIMLVKRRKISALTWTVFSSAAIVLALLLLPQSFWQRIFIGTFSKSPHAAELMTYAAVQGQTKLTMSFIDHGVPVNATDGEGNTAINAAAMAGDVELVQRLMSRGADLNTPNLYGDSPLGRAMENHQTKTAELLQKNGAINTIGTPEQQDRATRIIVDRQMKLESQEPH